VTTAQTVPTVPSPPEPLVVGPLTRTDFVRYQGASGDMNPIHHDETFAKQSGFDTPLSVGMFQAGVLAGWAAGWLGPHNVRRVKVRFKEQVWPGDVLTCSGTVAREYVEAGEHLVDVDLVCLRQTGAPAVEAAATFVVPTDEDSS
jgi:acyl dehydratase